MPKNSTTREAQRSHAQHSANTVHGEAAQSMSRLEQAVSSLDPQVRRARRPKRDSNGWDGPSFFGALADQVSYRELYEEVSELGRGSFGRVVLARSKAPDGGSELVASKMIDINSIRTRKEIQQLESEVRALCTLRTHRCIINYITCFQNEVSHALLEFGAWLAYALTVRFVGRACYISFTHTLREAQSSRRSLSTDRTVHTLNLRDYCSGWWKQRQHSNTCARCACGRHASMHARKRHESMHVRGQCQGVCVLLAGKACSPRCQTFKPLP